MSTPEQVAARLRAYAGQQTIVRHGVDPCIAEAIEALASQRATIERLERERDDWHRIADSRSLEIVRLRTALENAKEWLSGWASAEPYLAAINRALSTTGATTGEDRGNV